MTSTVAMKKQSVFRFYGLQVRLVLLALDGSSCSSSSGGGGGGGGGGGSSSS